MTISYFKATKRTPRFNQNQKVWIRCNCANHLVLWFRHRGSGRYVSGYIDKFSPVVGEIRDADVADAFAQRVTGLAFP